MEAHSYTQHEYEQALSLLIPENPLDALRAAEEIKDGVPVAKVLRRRGVKRSTLYKYLLQMKRGPVADTHSDPSTSSGLETFTGVNSTPSPAPTKEER